MSKLCDLFLNMITKIVNGWWHVATRAVVLFMGFRHIGCNCFPLCYWKFKLKLHFKNFCFSLLSNLMNHQMLLLAQFFYIANKIINLTWLNYSYKFVMNILILCFFFFMLNGYYLFYYLGVLRWEIMSTQIII